MSARIFRVLGVLGGAYTQAQWKAIAAGKLHLRSHAREVGDDDRTDGDGAPLCGRRYVRDPSHLVDDYGADAAGSVPTCPVCAAKLAAIPGAVVVGTPD